MTKTLKELLAKHPEWADLPIAVSDQASGEYHYVGASGAVYDSIDDDRGPNFKVLVFTGN